MRRYRSVLPLALLLALPLHAAAVDWNHNPDAATGPSFWGALTFPFATCGAVLSPNSPFVEVGLKQSPVDIAGAAAALLPAPIFLYGSTPFEVENTGHVVEVPYVAGSKLLVGLDSYDLVQFHFHAPSEHTVNGRLSSMELHLVHRNALGNLAVVGVLLQVGRNPNPVIEEIFANAPLTPGAVPVEGRTLNARELLPRNAFTHWTYSGSLTTPPCSEGVRWIVLKTPVAVSQAALDRYQRIISLLPGYGGFSANNRPVRPLNGRAILGN